MNIQEKLMMIQQELKAPKNQFNKFGNYKYRSLEDIDEAVKPLLKKYKCCLVMSDEIVNFGDRYYIKAIASFIDIEKDESVITCSAMAREALTQKGMADSQLTGATSSYARKYCLNGLFCIDDTKDADSGDNSKQKPEPSTEESFLSQMANFAKFNTKEYWEVMNKWQMKSAQAITNPDSQQNILKEIKDKINKA